MRFFATITACVLLSACSVLRDEAGYSGGYVSRVADDRLFVARSQKQQTDRYLMSLVILAPLAADLVQTPAQAKSAATLINSGYGTLANMQAAAKQANSCLDNPNCATTGDDLNSAFAFESHSYDMQRELYALAKLILSASDLDGLADDIVELDFLSIAQEGRRAWPVARRALATYRDTVVTFADAHLARCQNDLSENPCKSLNDRINQLKSGAPAGGALATEFDDRVIRALLSSIDKTAAGPAELWSLETRHIRGLVYHIDQACISLVSEQASDGTENLNKIENCGQTSARHSEVTASTKRAAYLTAAQ